MKLILGFLCILFLLGISSCTKSYECECLHQDSITGPDSAYTSTRPIKADLTEAASECETYEYFYDTQPYQAFSTCEIK